MFDINLLNFLKSFFTQFYCNHINNILISHMIAIRAQQVDGEMKGFIPYKSQWMQIEQWFCSICILTRGTEGWLIGKLGSDVHLFTPLSLLQPVMDAVMVWVCRSLSIDPGTGTVAVEGESLSHHKYKWPNNSSMARLQKTRKLIIR